MRTTDRNTNTATKKQGRRPAIHYGVPYPMTSHQPMSQVEFACACNRRNAVRDEMHMFGVGFRPKVMSGAIPIYLRAVLTAPWEMSLFGSMDRAQNIGTKVITIVAGDGVMQVPDGVARATKVFTQKLAFNAAIINIGGVHNGSGMTGNITFIGSNAEGAHPLKLVTWTIFHEPAFRDVVKAMAVKSALITEHTPPTQRKTACTWTMAEISEMVLHHADSGGIGIAGVAISITSYCERLVAALIEMGVMDETEGVDGVFMFREYEMRHLARMFRLFGAEPPFGEVS